MTVGALLDLGASREELERALRSAGSGRVSSAFRENEEMRDRCAMILTCIWREDGGGHEHDAQPRRMSISHDHEHSHAHEHSHPHPHRNVQDIYAIIDRLDTNANVKANAQPHVRHRGAGGVEGARDSRGAGAFPRSGSHRLHRGRHWRGHLHGQSGRGENRVVPRSPRGAATSAASTA